MAINELPLRGTYNFDEGEEIGLFKNLFEFTYLSSDIQNDIIKIMSEMVTENIVSDVNNADVPYYTILEDGTRDRNNRENIAIGVRFIKDGQVQKSILFIKTTENFDAKTLANITLTELINCGLDTNMILSQCYDGASVMSEEHGGVQAIIQKNVK